MHRYLSIGLILLVASMGCQAVSSATEGYDKTLDEKSWINAQPATVFGPPWDTRSLMGQAFCADSAGCNVYAELMIRYARSTATENVSIPLTISFVPSERSEGRETQNMRIPEIAAGDVYVTNTELPAGAWDLLLGVPEQAFAKLDADGVVEVRLESHLSMSSPEAADPYQDYMPENPYPYFDAGVAAPLDCGPDHYWYHDLGVCCSNSETCGDGVDNNCDGIVDDGCAGAEVMGDAGVGYGCTADEYEGYEDGECWACEAAERCGDGLDNDCNVLVDDGCESTGYDSPDAGM